MLTPLSLSCLALLFFLRFFIFLFFVGAKRREDFELAIASLRRALEVAPAHRNASKYLETTFLRRGSKLEGRAKLADALADFEQVKRMRGEHSSEAEAGIARVLAALARAERTAASKTAAARATFGGGSGNSSSSGGAGNTAGGKSVASSLYSLLTADAGSSWDKKSKKHKKSRKREAGSDSASSDDSASDDEHRRKHKRHKSDKKKKKDKEKERDRRKEE